MTEARQKVVRKENETRIKVHKKNGDHHGYREWIEKAWFGNLPVEEWRTDEKRWITEENIHGFAYGNLSEALQKHLGLDFLHGNNFFRPKQLKYLTKGIRDP